MSFGEIYLNPRNPLFDWSFCYFSASIDVVGVRTSWPDVSHCLATLFRSLHTSYNPCMQVFSPKHASTELCSSSIFSTLFSPSNDVLVAGIYSQFTLILHEFSI